MNIYSFRKECIIAAQDKATMEMESMEEGYLAKILVSEGQEGIAVGKARMSPFRNAPRFLLSQPAFFPPPAALVQ